MWGPGLVILAGIIGAVWLVGSVSKTGSRERRSPGLLEER